MLGAAADQADFTVNIVPPQENPRDTERVSVEKRLGCVSFSVFFKGVGGIAAGRFLVVDGVSGIVLACQNEKKLAAADVEHLSMLQQKMLRAEEPQIDEMVSQAFLGKRRFYEVMPCHFLSHPQATLRRVPQHHLRHRM